MRYCLGYEYKERVVDATGFQMGQSGTDLVQTHAVPIEASQAAATTACGMDYVRVNANLNWFDQKFAFAAQRCAKCENSRSKCVICPGRTISLGMSVRGDPDLPGRRSACIWANP
jgi:hypothetical protein